ncbi:hypothetical protein GQ473_03855 [archaeon]|nr:hypothetical protein [archaeon]
MTLRELGDCYEVNGRHFIDNFQYDAGARLCHGTAIGYGKIKGVKFGHCWIELNDILVIDISNGNNAHLLKSRYYEVGKITDVKRYTWVEFMKLIQKTGFWSGELGISSKQ